MISPNRYVIRCDRCGREKSFVVPPWPNDHYCLAIRAAGEAGWTFVNDYDMDAPDHDLCPQCGKEGVTA